MKTRTAAFFLSALAALGLPALSGQDDGDKVREAVASPDAAVIAEQLPSYPLKTCVVSGEELGSMGDTIDHVVDGRLVRLCCAGCLKPVKADSAKIIAKVDEAVIAAQGPTYPLATCVVSGEKFEETGEPTEIVIGTRLIRTCCTKCAKHVKADPTEFLAKVDAALIESQKASYPLTTCVVSGEPLDAMGAPVAHLYGVTLVQFCCKGCKKEFLADPAPSLVKLEAARAKKPAETERVEGGDREGEKKG